MHDGLRGVVCTPESATGGFFHRGRVHEALVQLLGCSIPDILSFHACLIGATLDKFKMSSRFELECGTILAGFQDRARPSEKFWRHGFTPVCLCTDLWRPLALCGGLPQVSLERITDIDHWKRMPRDALGPLERLPRCAATASHLLRDCGNVRPQSTSTRSTMTFSVSP